MKHLNTTVEQISLLPKLSADPRPTVSRRLHGRAQRATVLTSSPYKRLLERSNDKVKKKIRMKIQLFRTQMQRQMMGTPVGFASCVPKVVKRT
jgi:hypothetical protein